MKQLYSPKDIVKSGLCIGCGSCAAQAHNAGVDTHMQFDKYGQLKPDGPSSWFKRESESFTSTCPFSPLAKKEDELSIRLYPDAEQHNVSVGRFQNSYVGHVQEDDFRTQGSSG